MTTNPKVFTTASSFAVIAVGDSIRKNHALTLKGHYFGAQHQDIIDSNLYTIGIGSNQAKSEQEDTVFLFVRPQYLCCKISPESFPHGHYGQNEGYIPIQVIGVDLNKKMV